MIIVNLKGGLGNQMFQYATGFALAKRKKVNLFFDTRFIEEYKIKRPRGYVLRDIDLDIFSLKLQICSRKDLFKFCQFFSNYKIRNLVSFFFDRINFLVLRERKRIFDERFLNLKEKRWYLDGYWQSEKYFKDYRKEILSIFNFKKLENLDINKKFIKNITSKKSVCVNVRRKDFIKHLEHDVVNIEYYKKAIKTYKSLIGRNFDIYVFSDDLVWCKKNFLFFNKVNYVEHDLAGRKFFNYLYLMTKFKYFIIPNSTFAWWAAWLSKERDKKIIAPKKWSGLLDESQVDIVPHSWIKI
jgi:hypothetical protein